MILSPATALLPSVMLRVLPASRLLSSAMLYWAVLGTLAIAVLDAAPPAANRFMVLKLPSCTT